MEKYKVRRRLGSNFERYFENGSLNFVAAAEKVSCPVSNYSQQQIQKD